MKKYIYFVSIAYKRSDGIAGHGRGEQILDEPITTLDQIKQIEQNAKDFDPGIDGVVVINFQLLRTEDAEQTSSNRWN